MKLHRVMAVVMMSVSPFVLGACGGGSESVTAPGPSYPGVGGSWRGEWSSSASRPSTVTLSLSQSGSQIWGTLTVGKTVNEITGTIDEFGLLEFGGRDTNQQNGCAAFYTNPQLALAEQGSELTGPVGRASSDCSGGGRVLRSGGEMELDRVS